MHTYQTTVNFFLMNITIAVSLVGGISTPTDFKKTSKQDDINIDGCGSMLAKETANDKALFRNATKEMTFISDGCGCMLAEETMNHQTVCKDTLKSIPVTDEFTYDGCGGILAKETANDRAMFNKTTKKMVLEYSLN